MYSSPTKERQNAVPEEVESMSLLEWPKGEGVQRHRNAVMGNHCKVLVAANDQVGQH